MLDWEDVRWRIGARKAAYHPGRPADIGALKLVAVHTHLSPSLKVRAGHGALSPAGDFSRAEELPRVAASAPSPHGTDHKGCDVSRSQGQRELRWNEPTLSPR